MAIYAIGDVQGCCTELEQLLLKLHPDPLRDEIWFVGDLVNRGPRSLDTLRLVRSLGSQARVVLGNHDLHLIALTFGNRARADEGALGDVLDAPDGLALVDWLRHQPLAHYSPALSTLMVHAGVSREWSVRHTMELAGEVSDALRGPQCDAYLQDLYGELPDRWSPALTGGALALHHQLPHPDPVLPGRRRPQSAGKRLTRLPGRGLVSLV